MSHHCFAKKLSEDCEKSPSITQIKFAAAPKTVMLLQPISSAKGINPHNYFCAFQGYLQPWNAHCQAARRSYSAFIPPATVPVNAGHQADVGGEDQDWLCPTLCPCGTWAPQTLLCKCCRVHYWQTKSESQLLSRSSNKRSAAGWHKMDAACTQIDFV